MIAVLTRVAFASDPVPADLSVTSVGADAVRAESIDGQDANVLVGQRLRWTVARDTRVLADGRFSVDPDADVPWDESRVRELGMAHASDALTVLAGRHPLTNGGPRLVDGVQGLIGTGPRREVQLGVWAGAVPDEFTTAPTGRFGVGPLFAWTRSATTLSATGDFVLAGPQSRYSALALGRGELGARFELDGRLDWLFADGLGNRGLVDGEVVAYAHPTRATKIDAFWNGYSSLLYQTRASLDPSARRFDARAEDLGLDPGITADFVDPTLYHLLGASVSSHGSAEVRPVARLAVRSLVPSVAADPTDDLGERYDRLSALIGVGGIGGDRLEIDLDGNLVRLETGLVGDAGVGFLVEPDPHGALGFDGSFRVLVDPAEFVGYPGWYADGFVDWVGRSGTAVSAGGAWSDEPSDLLGQDVGIAAFLRVQQWIRPGQRAHETPDGRAEAQPPADDTES